MRAFVVCAFLIALIGPAHAAPPPPPACLAPYAAGEPDPDPRNVILTPSPEGGSVKVEACIVSNLERIATVNVFFGVFDQGGDFIAIGGEALGALGALDGSTPDHPRIIGLAALTLPIEPAYTGKLSDTVLVQIGWAPCKAAAPASCEPDSMRSSSFLRPYAHR